MAEDRNTSAAGGAAAVTKSDTTIVDCRSLYVGGAGDLVVTMARGGDVTFVGVPAGTFLPVQVQKVKAATTATNIVALF